METKKYLTMNDTVYFKLSQRGKDIRREIATAFHRENPQIDIKVTPDPIIGEWYASQIWSLFDDFGGVGFTGQTLPIYDITTIDPREVE